MKLLKKIVPLLIISVIVLGVFFWLALPVLSIGFVDFQLILFFVSIVIALVLMVMGIKKGWILPATLFLIMMISLVASMPLFHSKAYRNMIGPVNEKDFSTEIEPIDTTKLPVVDAELAKNLADKKLGEEVALGSQVTLGDFTLIKQNDQLYWVSPLLHDGFFKWINNQEGTPGYIKVSATNSRDIELVQNLDGKDVYIKYQPNAFFNQDLSRHVYFNGYESKGLTDYSFEIDDAGMPYWVITEYDNTIGLLGPKVKGVVVVDAQTGVITPYGIDDLPEWVDRAIPVDFAIDQLNDWGNYVHGVFNFSDKDKLKTTNGHQFVYNNGTAYIYTGITSAGSDESLVGFVLINTRNKETTLYKVSGSTENAAMSSAEGKVQEKEYTATFPILINVEGQPTYFMTLKDKKGLVKLYAFVNVNDYSIVGTGDNLQSSKSDYIRTMKDRGDMQGIGSTGEQIDTKAVVVRINPTVIEGTTYYYMTLKDTEKKIFVAGLNLSSELPLTMPGDTVHIQYYENTNASIDLILFENESLYTIPRNEIEGTNNNQ